MLIHPIYAKYHIDNEGQIYSLEQKIKPILHRSGYNVITLRLNGIQKQYACHRFVWEAFNQAIIPKGMQINHIDGIKRNNHPANLELVTPSENVQHAHRTGLKKGQPGETNSMSKISEANCIELIKEIKNGAKNFDLGLKYNLHPNYISLIRHKRRWNYLWQQLERSETIERQLN